MKRIPAAWLSAFQGPRTPTAIKRTTRATPNAQWHAPLLHLPNPNPLSFSHPKPTNLGVDLLQRALDLGLVLGLKGGALLAQLLAERLLLLVALDLRLADLVLNPLVRPPVGVAQVLQRLAKTTGKKARKK